MSFEYDLSSIVCPKCHGNNDNLEVIGLHIFTSENNGRLPYYDIKCYSCYEVFTKRATICLDEI